jgi:hypothetical protein
MFYEYKVSESGLRSGNGGIALSIGLIWVDFSSEERDRAQSHKRYFKYEKGTTDHVQNSVILLL